MICYNWELNDRMSIVLQIWDNFYAICLQVLTKKKQNTRRVYPAAIEKIKFFSSRKQPHVYSEDNHKSPIDVQIINYVLK